MTEWLNRAEALSALGIRAQTLYAYVSRGLIEARRASGSRHSLYRAADIAALAGRRDRSRTSAAIAAGAMAWGEPSVVTAISTVHRGCLIYRGRDAVAFARRATLEAAADLLWDSRGDAGFDVPASVAETPFLALAELLREAEASVGRGHDRLCRDARLAVSHLAGACGLPAGRAPLHLGLARLWSLDGAMADRVRQALVLLADHELNASTFATRVAASTGAPIAACLLAGLGALSGPKHGGAAAAVLRLLDEAEAAGPRAAVRAWLDRDGALPGFGHPLYPDGDVRAAVLAEHLPADALMGAVRDCAEEATGVRPNIDFALTALVRAAGLPRAAPFTIFLLGRSLGWAAHAMEQARQGTLIRPRARYEGERPGRGDEGAA